MILIIMMMMTVLMMTILMLIKAPADVHSPSYIYSYIFLYIYPVYILYNQAQITSPSLPALFQCYHLMSVVQALLCICCVQLASLHISFYVTLYSESNIPFTYAPAVNMRLKCESNASACKPTILIQNRTINTNVHTRKFTALDIRDNPCQLRDLSDNNVYKYRVSIDQLIFPSHHNDNKC